MNGILDRGVSIILRLQQLHPALDLPFIGFTLLGEEEFFMLMLPLLYWCSDRRTGARLGFIFLFSAWVNAVAKVIAGQPRPFEYDPRVLRIFAATGGGLPSGHTQSAVVVWGYLAAQFRRRWLWIVAAVFMVFIPLSRLYLGVHFPTDLLGGYVLGATLLLLYLWQEPRAEAWLARRGLAWQLGLALLVPALMAVVYPTVDESAVATMATLAGLGVGMTLERRWVGFEVAGSWSQRVLRFVLGAATIMALRFGLKALLPADPGPLLRFVRYGAIGLFVSLAAPWAFVRSGLARGRS